MKVFVVCCVLSIIKAEISDYSGLDCVPASLNQSLTFTGNETELHLQCKPHKKYLTWLHQGSPIAVVNHCNDDGVLLNGPANLTFSTRRSKLLLFRPFLPGIYQCVSGPCHHTFHLIPNTTSSPAPLLTNNQTNHHQRYRRDLVESNTTHTGGEPRGPQLSGIYYGPWEVVGLIALGLVAGGLLALCYLYLPCFSYLVVLCCWFKKWGRSP
ncbi:CR1-alpha/23.3 kDa protein [Human adenovirus 4p]|uniref:CR1-alpha/23.3 kDa protein n=1 Tax=Human adenovirus 4p TaxID=1643781 RepID=A0A3G9CMP6_ADE04|nr:CR1-alpha/23.3 kDa protein [Human adenovirus 4p]